MRSFIFSGYPHLDECDYIGKLVMPHLKTCSLPYEYGRCLQKCRKHHLLLETEDNGKNCS